jgi:MFS family permease
MKRSFTLKDFLLENTSHVIRLLIIGDVLFFSAVGLLGPIFALFVEGNIATSGNTAEVVGIATAIFLITRSIGQIPAARIVDKICGDRDDFWFMFWGLVVASIAPLLYLFISTPLELYGVQFISGLALAFNFPSFYGLFTKYIPQSREATAWSIYQTFIDLASAVTAAVGGYIATAFGFHIVIMGVTTIGLIGALALFPVRKHLRAYNC